MAPGIAQEREIQKSYWIEQSAGLKLEAMMHVHDCDASDLDKEDRHEVLSLLPSYEGKSVLELGAGIGRFTGDLAEKAGELVAVDFIEGVIKENESINGHHKNVKFMCADVTSPDLTFSPESVDLIFSNWLLMYLSDEEVQDLAERMMTWLKVGGYIFFRETCFHQSGDNKGKNNPTRYREPRFYTKVFQECNAGKSYELSLIGDKCIETYIRNKRNQNEICWIWQKVRSEDDKGFPHFLDTVQYKSNGITGGIGQEREIQKSYWIEQTAGLKLAAMMHVHDLEASDLDKEDRHEVLSLLPSYEGKFVLELGAGIGRLTGDLAEKAWELVAVDFIERVIKENESINGHHKNVKFMCADVTSPDLTFSPESVDLIFSNWLLMYLSDEEVQDLAERMITWLKVGGYIFFRETCFHQSGDNKGKNNPTHYREPRFYTKVFQECNAGKSYELSLVGYKCMETYVRNKRNQNEICWIWQKVRSDDDRGFQHFLDTVQYKSNGILRYERVFGKDFVSTGGIDTTKEFVAMLDLQPGEKVLDVGCGIGGGDFYMAEKYDVHVLGIDLSVNMISLSFERAIGRKCAVEFEVADCTVKTYPEGSFDVIYSRDTILHIQDKPALFQSFYKWLKPGGRVLISDYCKKAGPASEEFAAYIKQRGYDLHDVEAYGQMLRDAGFNEVIAEDRTELFMKVLQKELDIVEKERESFIQEFSEQDYNDIVGGWKAKLVRSSSGEQRWGLFIAKKN